MSAPNAPAEGATFALAALFNLLADRLPAVTVVYDTPEFGELSRQVYAALGEIADMQSQLDAAETMRRYGTPFDPTGVKTGIEIKSLRAALLAARRERDDELMFMWEHAHDFHRYVSDPPTFSSSLLGTQRFATLREAFDATRAALAATPEPR